MTDTKLSEALQADEPSTQQVTPKPAQNILYRILQILLAIGLLFFGFVMLLYIISKLPDTMAIANQTIYHTKYLGTQAKLNLFEYFLSRITLIVSSLLLITSGAFFILKRPKAGTLLFLGIALLGIQLIITVAIGVRELHENTKAKEAFSKKVETVDRTTVTDMTVIWNLKEPQLCKNIKTYHQRNNCVTVLGNEFFTPDFCNDFQGDERDICLADSAAAQKDREICNTIPDDFRKNYCIQSVAVAKKDLQLCEEIEHTSYMYNGCIVKVGIELRDPSYCEQADSQGGKDNCYDNIATFTQNRSLCEKISDQQYRESCIRKVEVQSN